MNPRIVEIGAPADRVAQARIGRGVVHPEHGVGAESRAAARVVVGFVSLGLLLSAGALISDSEMKCTGEGVWTASTAAGDTWTLLNMPLDNTKHRLGMTLHRVAFDPMLGGLSPGASMTDLTGMAQRKEVDLFDITT